ncbi:MAG: PH domain-containing protein [Candidatus Woesearchaeota archaeon]
MSFIDKHLGSTEKVILQFRPSRKSFLWEYLLFTLIIFISFGFLFTKFFEGLKNENILAIALTILFYIFLAISIILLIKAEYKIWSKAYAITSDRIMISEGIFTETFKSCVYSKITDIGLKQSLFDKIMNTGTIGIDTAGSDTTEVRLEKISAPFEVKKKISDLQSAATQQSHHPTMQSHQMQYHRTY